ncbi:hypothetical protein M885DRAFT_488014 [Pelagophyceae sp. CCMP2097]|nr:hypothetical protein M885DRAFT_488014 [Pelagophyceae sp. CCMP2097]|mmetsp:Transcript_20820/g.71579  ORF Transcript_20820/g.71579 Transcript_20820/m.71579 type:complete len:394 (+) Transcript_20820:283-1464(+)
MTAPLRGSAPARRFAPARLDFHARVVEGGISQAVRRALRDVLRAKLRSEDVVLDIEFDTEFDDVFQIAIQTTDPLCADACRSLHGVTIIAAGAVCRLRLLRRHEDDVALVAEDLQQYGPVRPTHSKVDRRRLHRDFARHAGAAQPDARGVWCRAIFDAAAAHAREHDLHRELHAGAPCKDESRRAGGGMLRAITRDSKSDAEGAAAKGATPSHLQAERLRRLWSRDEWPLDLSAQPKDRSARAPKERPAEGRPPAEPLQAATFISAVGAVKVVRPRDNGRGGPSQVDCASFARVVEQLRPCPSKSRHEAASRRCVALLAVPAAFKPAPSGGRCWGEDGVAARTGKQLRRARWAALCQRAIAAQVPVFTFAEIVTAAEIFSGNRLDGPPARRQC